MIILAINIFLSALILISVFCCAEIVLKGKNLTLHIKAASVVTVIIMILYGILYNIKYPKLWYCIYFAILCLIDWQVYYFVYYLLQRVYEKRIKMNSVNEIGESFLSSKSVLPRGVKGLLLVMEVGILLDNFRQIYLSITIADIKGFLPGVLYNNIEVGKMMGVNVLFFHEFLMIVSQIIILIILVKKILSTPSMYRTMYIILMIICSLYFVQNFIEVYTKDVTAYPIIENCIIIVLTYFINFNYRPKQLVQKMKAEVFNIIDDPALLFDYRGNLMLKNKSADALFFKDYKFKNYTDIDVLDFMEAWDIHPQNGCKRDSYFEWRILKEDGIRERYFNVTYKYLSDEYDRTVGYFLVFNETSETKYLECYDRLSGIYNRDYFIKETKELLAKYPKISDRNPYIIVAINIQSFKAINEELGTEYGDRILEQMGRTLETIYTFPGTYGRISADIFIFCMKKNDFSIRGIEDELASRVKRIGIQMEVRLAFGLYNIEKENIDVSAMCEKALLALGEARGNYLDNVIYYNDTMSEKILLEQSVISDMQASIDNNDFEVYLQPQFDLKNERICGAEALVRWNHPKKGFIEPDIFIPVFEKNGLIAKLDLYVWKKTCKYIRKWLDENKKMDDFALAINISRIDLYYLDIKGELIYLCERYQVPKKYLKLEITESAYLPNDVQLFETFRSLKKEGFTIEMDDFGSGYSSLNSLRNAPIDVLKLDMLFLANDTHGKRGATIVQAIVKMAIDIGLSVIAEGVESKEQVEQLKRLGCHVIQGYYYAKPMKVKDFEKRFLEI
ncbi:diguanylate cyclase (GGDEF) domain-containing protein [Lachnospiraceae bacterium C7]|nr:diguanylate cyclase (GGDEF) domain-containing protein [Lachnospiraceae bacterium C7]